MTDAERELLLLVARQARLTASPAVIWMLDDLIQTVVVEHIPTNAEQGLDLGSYNG